MATRTEERVSDKQELRDQSNSALRISAAEAELGRAASLLSEIVDEREVGDRDEGRGNSDDDLLAAVEELEGAIRSWRS